MENINRGVKRTPFRRVLVTNEDTQIPAIVSFDFLFFAIAKARVSFYFDNSMILNINGYLELSV